MLIKSTTLTSLSTGCNNSKEWIFSSPGISKKSSSQESENKPTFITTTMREWLILASVEISWVDSTPSDPIHFRFSTYIICTYFASFWTILLNHNTGSQFNVIGDFFVSKIGICSFQFHKILLTTNLIVCCDFERRYGLEILFELAALSDSYCRR